MKMNQQLSKNISLRALFYSISFAAKMRIFLNRFRKRKEIIKEWMDLQKTNLFSIETIHQKTISLNFPTDKANIIFQGLQSIKNQSNDIIKRLTNILVSKSFLFGTEIVLICTNFEVYGQYLKTYVQRLTIIKQFGEQCSNQSNHSGDENADSKRLLLQENSQKIVFRTYQISLLLAKYIKILSKQSKDMVYFKKAYQKLGSLNKKFDILIGEEQKEKQIQRIQRLKGDKINSCLIYTQKCWWHLGHIKLHVFENMILVEQSLNIHHFSLDKYCSVFIKNFDNKRLACLVTKEATLHFVFSFTNQLHKFVKVIKRILHVDLSYQPLSASIEPSLFPPFLMTQIVDYREVKDHQGSKEQFTLVFSAIYQEIGDQLSEQMESAMRGSIAQSVLNWTAKDLDDDFAELNETVILSMNQLIEIKRICETQYRLQGKMKRNQKFDDKISYSYRTMMEWQGYLNNILRSKIVINNPILILKQLHITDIFLEASLSKDKVSLQDKKKYHCKICSRVVVTTLKRYFTQRLHFLTKKYNSQDKEYCYYIFHKVRQEICKIPIHQINNCKQLIIWRQFCKGVIDYSFRKLMIVEKHYFFDVIFLSIQEVSFQVDVNQYTLVSEVIDQICIHLNVAALIGYRLIVYFQDEEVLLRSNELIFSILCEFNVKFEKSHSSSFFSKIKSLGRLIQLDQKGILILRQIIYYPLAEDEVLQIQWEFKNLEYQFKQEKLINLSKDYKLELIVLYSLKQLLSKSKDLPQFISSKLYQKYVPNSLEQQVQQSQATMAKLYETYKVNSQLEINRLIESKLSISPLFRKYVCEMKVVDMSQSFETSKNIRRIIMGIGWNQLVFLSFNQKIIMRCGWNEVSLILGSQGLKITSDSGSITLKGGQLYEKYQICQQYKAVKQWVDMIDSK